MKFNTEKLEQFLLKQRSNDLRDVSTDSKLEYATKKIKRLYWNITIYTGMVFLTMMMAYFTQAELRTCALLAIGPILGSLECYFRIYKFKSLLKSETQMPA